MHRPTNKAWSYNNNQVTLTYFTGFSDHRRKYLYVQAPIICASYGHRICIVGTPDMSTTTDRATPGLTYFSRSQGSKCKIKRMVNQRGTNCNRCTQRLVYAVWSPTDEPWSHISKMQVSLSHFTGRNPQNTQKWTWIGIFKPSSFTAHRML